MRGTQAKTSTKRFLGFGKGENLSTNSFFFSPSSCIERIFGFFLGYKHYMNKLFRQNCHFLIANCFLHRNRRIPNTGNLWLFSGIQSRIINKVEWKNRCKINSRIDTQKNVLFRYRCHFILFYFLNNYAIRRSNQDTVSENVQEVKPIL